MLSLDLEGPKTEVEKAIVELKKTFVVMDVIVEFREKFW